MSKNNAIFSLLGIGLITIGLLIFIHFTNDHADCENVVENSIGQNGENISTEKHICKEKFNL